MKKIMNKKIIIALCAVVAVGTITVGGTFALLTSKTNQKDNKFTHGVVNVTIEEEYKKDPDPNDHSIYYKKVSVKNNPYKSSSPEDMKEEALNVVDSYVSVKLVANWVDNETNTVLFENVELSPQKLGEGWVLIDGIYYYQPILKAGEVTVPLMEKVVVTNLSDLSENGHLELNVLATGVQASGHESFIDAWKNAGSIKNN